MAGTRVTTGARSNAKRGPRIDKRGERVTKGAPRVGKRAPRFNKRGHGITKGNPRITEHGPRSRLGFLPEELSQIKTRMKPDFKSRFPKPGENQSGCKGIL